MSVDNRISVSLTSDEQTALLAQLDSLVQGLAWTLSLSPTDRLRLSKAATGTEAFMNQAFQLGQQHPDLLPRGLSLEEMSRDLTTRTFLLNIKARLDTLSRRVDDTIAVCGSEAYQASLTIYRSAQTYGDDMGIDSQVEELARRFKRTTKSPAPSESPVI